ncbi:MAG: hypothetical protein NZ553_19515 [Caldilinea sp.]|nr:hypothetical protein [Caldilinea sp.]MDW8442672.1 interleukin-like EMT inducer domain-containing protein [Caldilineaceae bacterium]
MHRHHSLRPNLRWLGVLGFYTLLALLLTWPLAAHFATHTAGDGIDDPALAWNLWWIKEQMVVQVNPDIFHVDWMFHPIQINLAFYTLTPLNGLLSVPLQLGVSLVVANNLLLLASFVLSAVGAFLLVLDQRKLLFASAPSASVRWMAALLAGVIYAFASAKLFYAGLGQFNIASSQWIPFALLYLLRMARPEEAASSEVLRRRMRAAVFAALFFTFQLWAELTYASFLLIFTALLFLWQILVEHPRTCRTWLHLLWPYALFGVLSLVGMGPLLWAMIPDLLREGDFFASGGGFADIFSADLRGYLHPTRLHPLWGAFAAQLPFPNDKGQHIFLGYTAMVLSALGVWTLTQRRVTRMSAWLWGAAWLLFFALTLGPTLRWSGHDTGLPGPFSVISRLPFFSGNRYPSRYSVMLLTATAVLSAAGFAWLLNKLSANRARPGEPRPQAANVNSLSLVHSGVLLAFLTSVAVGAFLLEHLSTPLPLNDLRTPPIYRRLAQEPGDFAILELPTGWRNGARVLGRSDILIMMQQWWQTEHGKRRLGGNTSRNPLYKFQYFTEAPLLGELIALMNADRPHIGAVLDAQLDALIADYRPRAAQILRDLGVRYVVVHEDKATPQLLRFIHEALPLVEVDRWQDENGSKAVSTSIVRYALADEEALETRTISLVDRDAALYLGEGWATLPTEDGFRYATRRTPALLFDLPVACSELHIEGRGPGRIAAMLVNGRKVALRPLGEGELGAIIPAGVADRPMDRIELHIEGDPIPASQVIRRPASGGWRIGETDATLPADRWIVVRSAGEEVGDFAQIFVDGRDVARNERGYNLVALDAHGAVLDSAAFDVSGDERAAAELVAWVDRWPSGTVILGAVNDEASLKLNGEAVEALHGLGVTVDLRNHFRWSHAFIGAKGAPPGSALEVVSLIRPATVALGAPIDAPEVYLGLSSFTIAPCRGDGSAHLSRPMGWTLHSPIP